jgi:hypothetical protein
MASFRQTVLVVLATVLCVASYAEGQVLFSKLPKSLIVTATMAGGGPITEVHTGQDSIVVSWKVNTTAAPITTATKVQTKLCFAKVSQVLRAWRKTTDDLNTDKTCLYNIALAPFSTTGANATYKLPRSIPGAMYFVRAYALDANGNQVAFGGTSPDRIANIFTVVPITGRHHSIDIAVGIFSVFSVGSLFGFMILESIWLKRKKSV